MHNYPTPIQNWREQIPRAGHQPQNQPGEAGPRTAERQPLLAEISEELLRAYRQGMGVPVLARRFKRPQATIRRALNQARARHLRKQPMPYVYHPTFDEPTLEPEILRPMPGCEEYQLKCAQTRLRSAAGASSDVGRFDGAPLLTREQEAHLFRQMNFLKHRASQLLAQIDAARPRGADLDKIEEWLKQALEIRHHLVRSNLRLAVAATRKYSAAGTDLGERLSEGSLPLLRAIEKFDFSRGFKFSTYATWAIINESIRARPAELELQSRFRTGHEEVFASVPDQRSDEHAAVAHAHQAHQVVNRLLGHLNDREQRIVRLRAGLGAPSRLTLAEVGQQMGITKERVRQIERRALQKLRGLTLPERIEMPQ